MVDSALPPETPENAAAQEQPAPEGDTPVAATAADAVAAAPASPEAAPVAEPTESGTLASGTVASGEQGSGAAAGAPFANPTTTTITTPFADAQPSPAASVPPEAAAAPALAASPAGIASTISVPPLEQAPKGEGEGGEFELLINRVSEWLKDQDLPARWEGLQGPLRGLALLLLALVVLRLYGALIDTLDSLPLVPRLFQLVGVIVLVKFSLTHLVRTSDRERLISAWKQRWALFRGRV